MIPDDLMTIPEAAKLVRRNVWSVYGWVTERKVPSYKIAGKRFVSRADMEKLINFVPATGRPFKRPKDAEPLDAA